MKKVFFGLSIASVVAALLTDTALLDLPAIRNGWWSLLFFIVPLGFLILAWSPDQKGKLGAAATVVFILGLAWYVVGRTWVGSIRGTPEIAVGQSAPNFELKDQDGRSVELSDYTKMGRVVLVFFRGKNCPVCRGQLRELAGRNEDFKNSKVRIVAVGKVTPEEAKSMDLPFDVLSDADLAVAKKYGLIHEKGYMFQDVSRPTTIFLSQDRVIRKMWMEGHVRPRPSVAEIFDELRK